MSTRDAVLLAVVLGVLVAALLGGVGWALRPLRGPRSAHSQRQVRDRALVVIAGGIFVSAMGGVVGRLAE